MTKSLIQHSGKILNRGKVDHHIVRLQPHPPHLDMSLPVSSDGRLRLTSSFVHHHSTFREPTAQFRLTCRSILQGGYHHPTLRRLQNHGRNLTKSMLIYPIFISDDPEAEQTITSLPGQKRWGLNKLQRFLDPLIAKGLKAVILFGVPMDMTKVNCLPSGLSLITGR